MFIISSVSLSHIYIFSFHLTLSFYNVLWTCLIFEYFYLALVKFDFSFSNHV